MRIIARGFVLSRSRLVLLLRFLFFEHSSYSRDPCSHRHRESERESLVFRCCTTLVTNARTANTVCFHLLSHRRKYFFVNGQFVRVNQLAKTEPFNVSPFLFLEVSAQCVRTCVRACVRASTPACDPFAWPVTVH